MNYLATIVRLTENGCCVEFRTYIDAWVEVWRLHDGGYYFVESGYANANDWTVE